MNARRLFPTLIILLFAANISANAQDTAYDRLWKSVAEVLQDRNYGTARELLERESRLPTLVQFQQEIALDDHDCHLLLELKEKVIKRCQEFRPGEILTIGGLKYEFVRFDNNAKGEQLVLKFAGSNRENVKPLNTMNAVSWASLLDGNLPPTPSNRYVLGVFHAVDRTGDRQLARRFLSDAAGNNIDVKRWITRLERMEGKVRVEPPKPAPPPPPDPIAGSWRAAIKNGKKTESKNWTLNADGTTASGGKWTNRGNGNYTITFAFGQTVELELKPDGTTLVGRFANGNHVRADRQAP